jgi:hypothetical protein
MGGEPDLRLGRIRLLPAADRVARFPCAWGRALLRLLGHKQFSADLHQSIEA